MAIHSRLQPSGFSRFAVNLAIERLMHFSGRSFDKITGHEAMFRGSVEDQRFVPGFIVATKRLQPYCKDLQRDAELLLRLQQSGAQFVTLSPKIIDSYQKPYARHRPGLIFDLNTHDEISFAPIGRASPVLDLTANGRIAISDLLNLAGPVASEFGKALDASRAMNQAYKDGLQELKAGLGNAPLHRRPFTPNRMQA